jgi:hypothetical protein
MASLKTLNVKNLEALGAMRLAELLIEISTGDAAARRRLRLEHAGTAGTAKLSREIAKRLSTIAKARSFVEWNKVRPLVEDLTAQHRAIVEQVGKDDPAEALSLLWRFLALADPLYRRCDDSSGRISAVPHAAAQDLGPLAVRAQAEPCVLADRAFVALRENDHGEFDELIEILAPELGAAGLAHLKARITAWGAEKLPELPEDERKIVGWSSGSGRIYADEVAERHRQNSVRQALQQIADILGDVDGFVAQQDERARKVPAVAAGIGRRLLEAGRADEALAAIDAVETHGWIPLEWEQVRVDVLLSLGRTDEAQAFLWKRFEQTLNPEHLRAYLKKLPDFEDLEAEERAFAHAMQFPDIHRALAFFTAWPALDSANRPVLQRGEQLKGDLYELLPPTADILDASHPLAATIIRRALIDFTLGHARSKRYRHTARHLHECERAALRIKDFGVYATHATYVKELRSRHGRKSGFWQTAE